MLTCSQKLIASLFSQPIPALSVYFSDRRLFLVTLSNLTQRIASERSLSS